MPNTSKNLEATEAVREAIEMVWECENDEGVREYREAWIARQAKYASDPTASALVNLIIEACDARLGEEQS